MGERRSNEKGEDTANSRRKQREMEEEIKRRSKNISLLLTGLSALLLLGLHRYGVRKLGLLISILVFVMAGCYFAEMAYVKPPASEVMKGMFIPKLSGNGATGDAIALLGALVMPHNLFLHSTLVLSKKNTAISQWDQ